MSPPAAASAKTSQSIVARVGPFSIATQSVVAMISVRLANASRV